MDGLFSESQIHNTVSVDHKSYGLFMSTATHVGLVSQGVGFLQLLEWEIWIEGVLQLKIPTRNLVIPVLNVTCFLR